MSTRFRVALQPRRSQARLVRLARRRGRAGRSRARPPAERLALGVPRGRPGVDVRRAHRAVVPALVPAPAAGPQLGQPRRRGGHARRAALLAAAGRRRLPHRRAAAPRPRSAAARQRGGRAPPRPGLGDRQRPRPGDPARRGGVRRPDDRGRGRPARPAPRRQLPRSRRPAAPGAQLRVPRAAVGRRGVPGRDRRVRGAGRARPGRPGCRPATTTRVWRPATTATAADPRVRARWPCSSMGCAGRRSSTRARSSACPTRRSRPSASSTSTAATPSVRRSRGDRRRPPGRAPGSPAASRGCRSSPAPRTCASSARPPIHGPR